MSGKTVHRARGRALLLKVLEKLYAAVTKLLDGKGTTEKAVKIQQKLHKLYAEYLESHENALVAFPKYETKLNVSHIDVEVRHQKAVDQLQVYLNDGTKTDRSIHLSNRFSSR